MTGQTSFSREHQTGQTRTYIYRYVRLSGACPFYGFLQSCRCAVGRRPANVLTSRSDDILAVPDFWLISTPRWLR
jgi:hypothetical protein